MTGFCSLLDRFSSRAPTTAQALDKDNSGTSIQLVWYLSYILTHSFSSAVKSSGVAIVDNGPGATFFEYVASIVFFDCF